MRNWAFYKIKVTEKNIDRIKKVVSYSALCEEIDGCIGKTISVAWHAGKNSYEILIVCHDTARAGFACTVWGDWLDAEEHIKIDDREGGVTIIKQ